MAQMTITAGIGIRRALRHELERVKFEGEKIDWIEQKGFLASLFLINSSDDMTMALMRMSEQWNAGISPPTTSSSIPWLDQSKK